MIEYFFHFIPRLLHLTNIYKLIVPFQINAEGKVEDIFAEVTKALDALLA